MEETEFYYVGLPSCPILVARSSVAPWEPPTGPEAYHERKELRPVGQHPISTIWAHDLAPEVHAYLADQKVQWTSTELVRIGKATERPLPVVLWIGVQPKSLSGEDGHIVAAELQRRLQERGLDDVEVEIRESVVTRSAGPPLLEPASWFEATVNIVELLSASLGLPISTRCTPDTEGTGGIFMAKKGDNRDALYLLTARHVVIPPWKDDHKKYEYKTDSQPRQEVILFGDMAYRKLLMSIMTEIGNKGTTASVQLGRLARAAGKEGPRYDKELTDAQNTLDKANTAIGELYTLYKEVDLQWAALADRILGHVILSPPISFGTGNGGYTCDFAVIEIDQSKINASNFVGNVIDLGTEISIPTLTAMLHPNQHNPNGFTYPLDRLLHLSGTIPEEEMHNPTLLDKNDEPFLPVLKRGNATKLTVGHANTLASFIHIYFNDGDHEPETSMEWAILPHECRSGPFSAKGDSGSIIVDGLGRVGGLLTGGSGTTESFDITYATPIHFLLAEMEANGFKAHLNPQLG